MRGPMAAMWIWISARGGLKPRPIPSAENTVPRWVTVSPASMARAMVTVSRIAASGRPNPAKRSIKGGTPTPRPRIARPPASSSRAPISIAIRLGWRLKGLKTPMPMPIACVATALALAAGSTPRWNRFSANQTVRKPLLSAAAASPAHRPGSIIP